MVVEVDSALEPGGGRSVADFINGCGIRSGPQHDTSCEGHSSLGKHSRLGNGEKVSVKFHLFQVRVQSD